MSRVRHVTGNDGPRKPVKPTEYPAHWPKVHALASKAGVSSKDWIKAAKALGVSVKSASSQVSPEDAQRVHAKLRSTP